MTVEQASIEQVFHRLGYKSSQDYAVQKAKNELLNELKTCIGQIAVLEKKYGMSYEEFHVRFNELTQFSLFEREDDIMEWRVQNIEARSIEKLLIQLVP